MQFRLLDTLGTADATACNKAFAAGLGTTPKDLAKGAVIDLNDAAANFLKAKYPALLEPVEKVKGVAKQPEVAGVKS